MVDRTAKENSAHVAVFNSSFGSSSYLRCLSGTFTVLLLIFFPHLSVQSDLSLLISFEKTWDKNDAEAYCWNARKININKK